MSDIDLLESVLAKDEALLAGVRPEQLAAQTPCPDYDVRTMVNHIVGWAQVFAAGANGLPPDVDTDSYEAKDAVAEFRTAADDILAGWRQHGTDRTVTMLGNGLPGSVVLGMTLMEYLTHGCDLAVATGQQVPFTDEEVQTTFDHARATLPDAFRGAGKPFGLVVEVDDDAHLVDRFLGFMGRRPPS